MAVTFFERDPDKITIVGSGRDRGYVFQFFEPSKGDEVGAVIVAMSEPHSNYKHWHAVKMYRVGRTLYGVMGEWNLTESEALLFEQRVKTLRQTGVRSTTNRFSTS